jgi:hypothetical protein
VPPRIAANATEVPLRLGWKTSPIPCPTRMPRMYSRIHSHRESIASPAAPITADMTNTTAIVRGDALRSRDD